jgi:DNA/RNA non-specific endonuclease
MMPCIENGAPKGAPYCAKRIAATIGDGTAFARYWQYPRYDQSGHSQAFSVTAISGTFNRNTRVTYQIDSYRRTTQASGQLRVTDRNADRGLPRLISGHWQRLVGGKQSGDHAWHMAGGRFGGAAELYNLVAYDGNLNVGSFNQFERGMANAIGRDGFAQYNMVLTYNGSGPRPTAINASYKINGQGEHIRWNPRSRTGR